MNPIVFIVLAAVLIGVAFYLVALPLIQHARRNDSDEAVSSEQERLGELLAQRDSAFQALRELSFDHQVGKVTDQDFTAFDASLKQNAVQTLRALDAWEAEADDELEAVMEREIRGRKLALAGAGAEPDGRVCTKCGTPAMAGDRFCAKCGAVLGTAVPAARSTATEYECPQCGAPYEAGDKFCAKCGQTLAAEVAPVAR